MADCLVCATPMIVWRTHGLPDAEVDGSCWGGSARWPPTEPGGYWIDGERRRIPDHWHAHARPGGVLRPEPLGSVGGDVILRELFGTELPIIGSIALGCSRGHRGSGVSWAPSSTRPSRMRASWRRAAWMRCRSRTWGTRRSSRARCRRRPSRRSAGCSARSAGETDLPSAECLAQRRPRRARDRARIRRNSSGSTSQRGLRDGSGADRRDRRGAHGVRRLHRRRTIAVFGDVHVKHATPLLVRPIGESALDLVERGLADALVVSGPARVRPPRCRTSPTPAGRARW